MHFGWLHIGDLHQSNDPSKSLFARDSLYFGTSDALTLGQNAVRAAQDIERTAQLCAPWNAVFLTGDVARRGDELEYEFIDDVFGAQPWGLNAVLSRVARGSVRWFVVPGNHDIKRVSTKESATLYAARSFGKLWDKSDSTRNEFWRQALARNSDHLPLQLVRDAHRAFLAWRARRPQPANNEDSFEFSEGILPGEFAASFVVNGDRIGVLGLNTVFRQLVDLSLDAAPTLDMAQAVGLVGDIAQWSARHDARFLLTHNGLDPVPGGSEPGERHRYLDARGAESAQRLCAEAMFTAWLHGSTRRHEPLSQVSFEGAPQTAPTYRIAAPSLLGERGLSGEDRPFGYTAGRIQPVGPTSFLRVWPRSFELAGDSLDRSVPTREWNITARSEATEPVVVSAHGKAEQQLERASRERTKILSLHVENFKGLASLSVRFDAEQRSTWACLAGENGCGKSSVLQAAALLLLGPEPVRDLGTELRRHFVSSDATAATVRGDVEWKGEIISLGITLRADGTGAQIMALASEDPEEQRAMQRFWSERSKEELLLGFGTGRTFPVVAASFDQGRSRDLHRAHSLFDGTAPLESYRVLLGQLPRPQNFTVLVNEALVSLSTAGWDKMRLVETSDGVRVELRSAQLPLWALADGYRAVVTWIAEVIFQWTRRCDDAKDEAVGGLSAIRCTVLIDELDLHLHGRLQRTIVPMLRGIFSNVQWITTTHSPLLAGSFYAHELLLLSRDEHGRTVVKQADRSPVGLTSDGVLEHLMGVPEPFSEELERHRRDILRAQGATPPEPTPVDIDDPLLREDSEAPSKKPAFARKPKPKTPSVAKPRRKGGA